jgi:hypothetical protein
MADRQGDIGYTGIDIRYAGIDIGYADAEMLSQHVVIADQGVEMAYAHV